MSHIGQFHETFRAVNYRGILAEFIIKKYLLKLKQLFMPREACYKHLFLQYNVRLTFNVKLKWQYLVVETELF